ncbi:MAG: hypothetical protein SFU86_04410 [Pirellulaceae bacterium]|nr:hypothetical protein [Pirellulaceae bacterium]
MRRLLAVMAIFTAFSVPSFAQEGQLPAGFDAAKLAELQKQLITRFDADKDGKLSQQEQLAAMEFASRNGGLGGAGVPSAGFPGVEQFTKQFDKDGDGKLSAQEQIAASAAFQRMREGGGKGPQTGVFPGGTAAPAAPTEKPSKLSPLAKRFDKDGDGKLSDEEKAALQAEAGRNKGKAKEAKAKKAEEKPAK